MKKLFFIATAAVVALAACSKVDTVNTTPDQAITFQVAKYSLVQTKADPETDTHGHTSLKDEGFELFQTYAWYTSKDANGDLNANQAFMAPATVEFDDANDLWHATDRTYYWPKTGYINFFSFAGDHLPDAVALDDEDSYKAKAHYTTQITVATDDNILIADGAYGFYNNDGATHQLDNVTKGVPTLFRHMLSRVKFDICVDATDATDDKDNWAIVVNSATLSYRNKGTLEVAFPATPSITLGADNKPTAAGQTLQYTSQVWTPASVDNVTLSKVDGTVTANADGGERSDAEVLIADSVVMPQTIATTNVTIALTYTLTHTYNGAGATVETVPVAATLLTTFTPSILTWNPNSIYTYHIIVKPAGEILFDPAVETWIPEDPTDADYNADKEI